MAKVKPQAKKKSSHRAHTPEEIDLDNEELDALDSIQEEGDAPIAAASAVQEAMEASALEDGFEGELPKPVVTPTLSPQAHRDAALRRARMKAARRRR